VCGALFDWDDPKNLSGAVKHMRANEIKERLCRANNDLIARMREVLYEHENWNK